MANTNNQTSLIADLTAAYQNAAKPATGMANKADLPKAKFWINIGYDSGVMQEDNTTRFVSLPQGIPVDTQEPVNIKSSNADYSKFQQARNHLLEKVIELGEGLEPGESRMVNLQIQLRRVVDEVEETPEIENEFIAKLAL